MILVSFPNLVRNAAKECAARYSELFDAAPIPDQIECPPGTQSARLNVYGVIPPDINNDEAAFAAILEKDLSGTVEWWHRNEPRKPWSVGLVLPNGGQYFPDFIIKVKGRKQGDGILPVEIKGDHILNSTDTLDKVNASHQAYKRPMMLTRESDGRFMTVRQDEQGKNYLDQVFRIELLIS